MQKTTVKCITESGDSWVSTINLSEKEAHKYYFGKVFNLGTDGDRLERVVLVETVN